MAAKLAVSIRHLVSSYPLLLIDVKTTLRPVLAVSCSQQCGGSERWRLEMIFLTA